MTHRTERSDWIEGLRLISYPDLDGETATALFDSPAAAIETLALELRLLWERYRSSDPNERRIGLIELGRGAYFQWIGYSTKLAVECTSNTFLPPEHQLTPDEEDRLIHWGFHRPTDELPNFWIDVERRRDAEAAAFAIVAALTTVFGVYAG